MKNPNQTKTTFSGKTFISTLKTQVDGKHLFQFEKEELTLAGWIRITECGSENLYFDCTDDSGNECLGYCKCL